MSQIKDIERKKIKEIESLQNKEIRELQLSEKILLLLLILPYDIIKCICDYFIKINEQLCIAIWAQKIENMVCVKEDCNELLGVSKFALGRTPFAYIRQGSKIYDYYVRFKNFQYYDFKAHMNGYDNVFKVDIGDLYRLMDSLKQQKDNVEPNSEMEFDNELEWHIEYGFFVNCFYVVKIKSIFDLPQTQKYLKEYSYQLCEKCYKKLY
jgi:hypothetical protein